MKDGLLFLLALPSLALVWAGVEKRLLEYLYVRPKDITDAS